MAASPWDGPTVVADNVLAFEAWRSELIFKADGVTLEPKRFANFRVMLSHHGALQGAIRLNQFSGGIEVGAVPWNRSGEVRKLNDLDASRAREWLQGLGLTPTKDEARDAMEAAAAGNAYHPIRDYLAGLHWDGTPRLAKWLSAYMAVADTPYCRAIGPKALISAVARVMRPGCQVDTMLVLEGPQGFRKSSAISALFGRDHTLEAFALFGDQKRMVMSLMGKWAVEIAEFAAIKGAELSKVKGLISARVDTVALNYARTSSDHPRQSVFFGSINPGESGYLGDDTGNRRYWPVEVTRAIDVPKLATARDQLWAEAYDRFNRGETWWLADAEQTTLAAPEQKAREESHPWDDLLVSKLSNSHIEMTSAEALTLIGLPALAQTKAAQMTIATSLRRAGFVRKHDRAGAKRLWRLATAESWEASDDPPF